MAGGLHREQTMWFPPACPPFLECTSKDSTNLLSCCPCMSFLHGGLPTQNLTQCFRGFRFRWVPLGPEGGLERGERKLPASPPPNLGRKHNGFCWRGKAPCKAGVAPTAKQKLWDPRWQDSPQSRTEGSTAGIPFTQGQPNCAVTCGRGLENWGARGSDPVLTGIGGSVSEMPENQVPSCPHDSQEPLTHKGRITQTF